jgi:hypothetical protein
MHSAYPVTDNTRISSHHYWKHWLGITDSG